MEFNKREIKLFIISGKARSGKNEVSNIINNTPVVSENYSIVKDIIICLMTYMKILGEVNKNFK